MRKVLAEEVLITHSPGENVGSSRTPENVRTKTRTLGCALGFTRGILAENVANLTAPLRWPHEKTRWHFHSRGGGGILEMLARS